MVDFGTKGIRVEDDMHINQLVISLFMSKGALVVVVVTS